MFFQIKRSNFAFVNQLARHIEILLLRNDCVIVPGLGGFTASHVPSAYDSSDCMFLPPTRTLGFNPKLNINDSLLVHSYSEVYDLSYPDALTRIKGEVEEIKQEIEYEGSYELNDIGTLYNNNEGRMEFKPCEAGLLTPDLYSLSSFEIKSIRSQQEQPSVQHRMETTEGSCVTIKSEPKNTQKKKRELACGNKVTTSSSEKRGHKTINIKIGTLRNVAAAAIAIIFFFLFATPISDNKNLNLAGSGSLYQLLLGNVENKNINNAHTTRTNAVGFGKELETAKNQQIPKEAKGCDNEEPTGSQNNNRTVQTAPEEGRDFFCIVLASHVTLKNANEFAKRLNSDGFKTARVLSSSKSSVKVIYGNYVNDNDAYRDLNKLKDNEYFHEAWVHHVKN